MGTTFYCVVIGTTCQALPICPMTILLKVNWFLAIITNKKWLSYLRRGWSKYSSNHRDFCSSDWTSSAQLLKWPLHGLVPYLVKFLFLQSRSTSRVVLRSWEYVFSCWGIKRTWISICKPYWHLLARFSSSVTIYIAKWLSLRNSAAYSSIDQFHCWSRMNCSSISFLSMVGKNLS